MLGSRFLQGLAEFSGGFVLPEALIGAQGQIAVEQIQIETGLFGFCKRVLGRIHEEIMIRYGGRASIEIQPSVIHRHSCFG
jgi:hypothetical protein